MVVSPGVALNIFVAGAMLVLATTLLVAGRRRPESVVLAVFIGLVAVNFASNAVLLAPESGSESDRRFQYLAFVALGLDPLYLLLFVTMYPYPRRPLPVRALLGLVAVMAVISVGFAVFAGPYVVTPGHPYHTFVILELALAYSAAWVLSLQSAVSAPTPLLARRAVWTVAAVGVAVVPRLGRLPNDYAWSLYSWLTTGSGRISGNLGVTVEDILVDVVPYALLCGLALLAGFVLVRRSARPTPGLGTALVFVGGLAALFALVHIGLDAVPNSAFRNTVLYGLRWVVFAAMLLYGILAYEIVEFDRATDRVIPLVGGVLASLAGFLVTLVYVEGTGAVFVTAVSLAVAVALGASLPAASATRAAVRSLGRAPSDLAQRRLELYRAALEAAWSRGSPTPDARRRLEQDRKAFGVSIEEARALEHVVASGSADRGVPSLRPGDEVPGGLVLESLLGEGAHGRAFAARRYPGGERVVVKEIRSGRSGAEATRGRLLRELRPLQRLAHPNIARLLDVRVAGGRYFLVMEYVEGLSLAERLRRGPLQAVEVAQVFDQVLDALEAAHAAGVVHCDVKPSNILLGRDGHARLTDFGIATVEEEPQEGGTATGFSGLDGLAGTLAYMAPEQARGQRASPASDVYAVGLCLYEALTGKPALDLGGMPLLEAAAAVSSARVDLRAADAAWRPFLARGLQPDPARRFRSAAEMRDAMRSLLHKGGTGARHRAP